MTACQKNARRMIRYVRYREATTVMLERNENIAAIIFAHRALAWYSLSLGDSEAALDNRLEARWFLRHDAGSAALVHKMTGYWCRGH